MVDVRYLRSPYPPLPRPPPWHWSSRSWVASSTLQRLRGSGWTPCTRHKSTTLIAPPRHQKLEIMMVLSQREEPLSKTRPSSHPPNTSSSSLPRELASQASKTSLDWVFYSKLKLDYDTSPFSLLIRKTELELTKIPFPIGWSSNRVKYWWSSSLSMLSNGMGALKDSLGHLPKLILNHGG